jgi:hypothetical protein
VKISDEMVERFCNVYWQGDWPYQKTEADRELSNELRGYVRAALEDAVGDMVLVPVRPTFEMASAIGKVMQTHYPRDQFYGLAVCHEAYAALLAAANGEGNGHAGQ